MPSGPGERYDFFLSRRGSVAAIAREVADVLTGKGYVVFVQDYDIRFGDSFIQAMHDGITNARDLIILFTHDYLQSPYTRKEFTSFEAQRLRSQEERHIVVLRCDDAPLVGLLSDNVYQTLTTRAEVYLFFESRGGPPFLETATKKGTCSARPVPSSCGFRWSR